MNSKEDEDEDVDEDDEDGDTFDKWVGFVRLSLGAPPLVSSSII